MLRIPNAALRFRPPIAVASSEPNGQSPRRRARDRDAPAQPQDGADGRIYLDLWAANRALLQAAGVKEVEVAGICTSCNVGDFYSARRENRRNGCFGAAIVLEPLA